MAMQALLMHSLYLPPISHHKAVLLPQSWLCRIGADLFSGVRRYLPKKIFKILDLYIDDL